jgi:hypothetical protein
MGAGGIRETKMHTAEPSASEVEGAIRSCKDISHQVLFRFQQK